MPERQTECPGRQDSVPHEAACSHSLFRRRGAGSQGTTSAVEIAFSTFKRVLGECISARKWENVKAEIYGKVQLYNQMIDTAIDNGHGTPKIVHVYKPGPGTAGNKGAR